jgi:hypothetical protein
MPQRLKSDNQDVVEVGAVNLLRVQTAGALGIPGTEELAQAMQQHVERAHTACHTK